MTNHFAISEDYSDEVPAEFRTAVLNNPLLSFLISDELKSNVEWTYADIPKTIPRHHPELLKIIADLNTQKIYHNWKIVETGSDLYVVFIANFYNSECYKVSGFTSFSDPLPTPPEPEGSHVLSEAQKELIGVRCEALMAVINSHSQCLSLRAVESLHKQVKEMLDPELWDAAAVPDELPNIPSFLTMVRWLATNPADQVGPGLGFSVQGNVIASWVTTYFPSRKTIIEFLPNNTVKWSVSHSNDLDEPKSFASGNTVITKLSKVLSGF